MEENKDVVVNENIKPVKKIQKLWILMLLIIISVSAYSIWSYIELNNLKAEINKNNENIKKNIFEINTNKNDIASETNKLIQLKNDNSNLESKLTYYINLKIKRKELTNQVVHLDVNSNGYSVAKTNIGSLLFIVNDVEEYLSGIKLHLEIGNPNYITLSGLDLEVAISDKYYSIYDEFDNGNFRNITVSEELQSNKWTDVTIIIDDFDIKNDKFIGIIPIIDTIRLK